MRLDLELDQSSLNVSSDFSDQLIAVDLSPIILDMSGGFRVMVDISKNDPEGGLKRLTFSGH